MYDILYMLIRHICIIYFDYILISNYGNAKIINLLNLIRIKYYIILRKFKKRITILFIFNF